MTSREIPTCYKVILAVGISLAIDNTAKRELKIKVLENSVIGDMASMGPKCWTEIAKIAKRGKLLFSNYKTKIQIFDLYFDADRLNSQT